MKRFAVLIAVLMVFSAVTVFAEDMGSIKVRSLSEPKVDVEKPVVAKIPVVPSETQASDKSVEKEDASWKVIGEVNVGIHNKYLDETTGEVWFDDPVSSQSATIGIEKEETGFYIQAENFIPFEKQESKETDFYAGFYTKFKGMRFDFGFSHYWIREKGEIDYSNLYGSVEFPEICWVTPFLRAEYRFGSKKFREEDEDGNEFSTSMDGFAYNGGVKKEFKISERVSLAAEVSVGGNTGIHGYDAENLAYAREKVEVTVSLTEKLNMKIAGTTQQNIGKSRGIAKDTDKDFFGLWLVWNF